MFFTIGFCVLAAAWFAGSLAFERDREEKNGK